MVPAMQDHDQETEVVEEDAAANEEIVEENGNKESSEEESPEEESPEEESPEEESPEEESPEGRAPEVPLTPEAEAMKWKEAAIRSAADLDNYRKRMARERSEDLRFARSGLVEELLPIFDNFAMGLQMAEQEQDSMIYKGMAMVKGQLDDFLSAQGVKEVTAEGIFDPNFHEAVAEEEKEGADAGEILFVKRKGYVLHDRLLRAAAVIVAKGGEESVGEDAENEGGAE